MNQTSFMSVESYTYRPLSDIVFDAIRAAIISGEFKPGERLMEMQLAESMRVSRTPIREALRKLEIEGLVVMVPKKGAYVADLSLRDIVDILEVHITLEALAASLAAERIIDDELDELRLILSQMAKSIDEGDNKGIIDFDMKFHMVIYSASRNGRLSYLANQNMDRMHSFLVMSLDSPRRPEMVLIEHQRIIEALAERSPDLSSKWALSHMGSLEDSLIRLLDKEVHEQEE